MRLNAHSELLLKFFQSLGSSHNENHNRARSLRRSRLGDILREQQNLNHDHTAGHHSLQILVRHGHARRRPATQLPPHNSLQESPRQQNHRLRPRVRFRVLDLAIPKPRPRRRLQRIHGIETRGPAQLVRHLPHQGGAALGIIKQQQQQQLGGGRRSAARRHRREPGARSSVAESATPGIAGQGQASAAGPAQRDRQCGSSSRRGDLGLGA